VNQIINTAIEFIFENDKLQLIYTLTEEPQELYEILKKLSILIMRDTMDKKMGISNNSYYYQIENMDQKIKDEEKFKENILNLLVIDSNDNIKIDKDKIKVITELIFKPGEYQLPRIFFYLFTSIAELDMEIVDVYYNLMGAKQLIKLIKILENYFLKINAPSNNKVFRNQDLEITKNNFIINEEKLTEKIEREIVNSVPEIIDINKEEKTTKLFTPNQTIKIDKPFSSKNEEKPKINEWQTVEIKQDKVPIEEIEELIRDSLNLVSDIHSYNIIEKQNEILLGKTSKFLNYVDQYMKQNQIKNNYINLNELIKKNNELIKNLNDEQKVIKENLTKINTTMNHKIHENKSLENLLIGEKKYISKSNLLKYKFKIRVKNRFDSRRKKRRKFWKNKLKEVIHFKPEVTNINFLTSIENILVFRKEKIQRYKIRKKIINLINIKSRRNKKKIKKFEILTKMKKLHLNMLAIIEKFKSYYPNKNLETNELLNHGDFINNNDKLTIKLINNLNN